ncbi:unnamed protein product [Schistosoma turkestanicum]|nr:unnamed protein product [Schistosoma turkestanicum]
MCPSHTSLENANVYKQTIFRTNYSLTCHTANNQSCLVVVVQTVNAVLDVHQVADAIVHLVNVNVLGVHVDVRVLPNANEMTFGHFKLHSDSSIIHCITC